MEWVQQFNFDQFLLFDFASPILISMYSGVTDGGQGAEPPPW